MEAVPANNEISNEQVPVPAETSAVVKAEVAEVVKNEEAAKEELKTVGFMGDKDYSLGRSYC